MFFLDCGVGDEYFRDSDVFSREFFFSLLDSVMDVICKGLT